MPGGNRRLSQVPSLPVQSPRLSSSGFLLFPSLLPFFFPPPFSSSFLPQPQCCELTPQPYRSSSFLDPTKGRRKQAQFF